MAVERHVDIIPPGVVASRTYSRESDAVCTLAVSGQAEYKVRDVATSATDADPNSTEPTSDKMVDPCGDVVLCATVNMTVSVYVKDPAFNAWLCVKTGLALVAGNESVPIPTRGRKATARVTTGPGSDGKLGLARII